MTYPTTQNLLAEVRELRRWVVINIAFTAALAGEKAIEIILALVA